MDSILVCFKTKIIEIQKVIAQTFYSKVEVILCGYHAPRRATNYVHFRAKNDFVHTLMNTTI